MKETAIESGRSMNTDEAQQLPLIDENRGFMRFDSIENAIQCAEIMAKSSIVPASYQQKPGDIVVAVQFGLELGLKPVQALQNIAVIGGRPCIWGDAMLALCRQKLDWDESGWFETFDEKNNVGICRVKRAGGQVHEQRFSFDDAKMSTLFNKAGPWKSYPKRMCVLRARGFALRNVFAHHLKGLKTAEEVRDEQLIQAERVVVASATKQVKHELRDAVEKIMYLANKKGEHNYVERCLQKAQVSQLAELELEKLAAIITALEKKDDVSQADALANRLGAE